MKIYARVVDGQVLEMLSDSDEFTIDQLFPPEFVQQCVEVTNVAPMPAQNWTFNGSVFSEPVVPVPTAAQILVSNTSTQAALMATANAATSGMANAYVLGLLDAADTAKFKTWAAYQLDLSKVDLTSSNPAWPTPPAA